MDALIFKQGEIMSQFKVRIYLLSGQNISAMNNVIDFKSMLAGMYAMTSSNPYPIVMTGSGNNDGARRITRK